MIIVNTGDLHLRFLAPQSRTDNFFDTQFNKMQFIYKVARKHNADIILQPGDFWDANNPSKAVMSRYIRFFRANSDIELVTVLGQHDMVMRSWQVINRTATYLLESAGVITTVGLDFKPLVRTSGDSSIAIHGLSYGQEYELKRVEKAFNILLAHASVGDRPLFPGHKLEGPRAYIRQHSNMDLIVVGDYHYSFYDKLDNTEIINAGCLVRKSISKWDLEHKPTVVVYNTETRERKVIEIPIKPIEEVFDVPENIEEGKNDLKEFLESLATDRAVTVSFRDNLNECFKEDDVPKDIVKYISNQMVKMTTLEKERLELNE